MLRGRVIRVVFKASATSAEISAICSACGPFSQESQKDNSFIVYLENGMSIDRVDRMISRLRRYEKVRDAVLMSP